MFAITFMIVLNCLLYENKVINYGLRKAQTNHPIINAFVLQNMIFYYIQIAKMFLLVANFDDGIKKVRSYCKLNTIEFVLQFYIICFGIVTVWGESFAAEANENPIVYGPLRMHLSLQLVLRLIPFGCDVLSILAFGKGYFAVQNNVGAYSEGAPAPVPSGPLQNKTRELKIGDMEVEECAICMENFVIGDGK